MLLTIPLILLIVVLMKLKANWRIRSPTTVLKRFSPPVVMDTYASCNEFRSSLDINRLMTGDTPFQIARNTRNIKIHGLVSHTSLKI